jgi:alanine-synthesizing transaminase
MFSRRTDWPRGDNVLSTAWVRLVASGLPCLDLTEANPTRVGLPLPELDSVAALVGWRRYEPESFGAREARDAVAAYHGHRVGPDSVWLNA